MTDQPSSMQEASSQYSSNQEDPQLNSVQIQSNILNTKQIDLIPNQNQHNIHNQHLTYQQQPHEFYPNQQYHQMSHQQYGQNFSNLNVQGNEMQLSAEMQDNFQKKGFPHQIGNNQMNLDHQFNQLQINNHQHSEQFRGQQQYDPNKQDFFDDPSIQQHQFKNYSTPTKEHPRQQNSLYENQNAYIDGHQGQDSYDNNNQMGNLFPSGIKNQKIPQTDKLRSQHRKISETHDIRGNSKVYLDEQKNQLSEVLDPPDDNSMVGQEKILIGDCLEQEDFNSELLSKNNFINIRSNEDNDELSSGFNRDRNWEPSTKRHLSQHVQKSRVFENDPIKLCQNDQFIDQQYQNLNQNTPQIGYIRSQQFQYPPGQGQQAHPQYVNQGNYQHQYQYEDQRQQYPQQQVIDRQQYFQQQNQMLQRQLNMNKHQQMQQMLQTQQQFPQDININLPQTNMQGNILYQNQISGQQNLIHAPAYIQPRNQIQQQYGGLSIEEVQQLQKENQILKQKEQNMLDYQQRTHQFDHFKKGQGIKAFNLNEGDGNFEIQQNQRIPQQYSNQIQPGQSSGNLSNSLTILNNNYERKSHQSVASPSTIKKPKKQKINRKPQSDKQKHGNESLNAYHDAYFDNQDDYNVQHQGQYSQEGGHTSDTKGTRSGGSKSNKATYQQNNEYQLNERYEDKKYKNSNSSYGSGGHHGTGSHHSGQSFEQRLHQIQFDINKVNGDPDKEWEILDGHILELATKKVGSRFLQEHLKEAKQTLINKIIEQIDGHLPDLMMDNYGNYFCSAIIRYLQVHQRYHFLKQIKGQKFVDISCNNRGTYTLQAIIEAVTQDEEFQLIEENLLQNNNICILAMNKDGEHMIEKIIKTFPEDKRQYVFDNICDNFKELATNKQGLCVMKKLIEFTKNKNSQKIIIQKIIENPLMLVQNEFGNFVVSEVLQQFDYDINKEIYDQMKGNFVNLSQNKYSSKFIEICIEKAPVQVQYEIFDEFCQSQFLPRVIQSNFGNYVLQKSLKEFQKTEDQKIKLLTAIVSSLYKVDDYKVQQKWGNDLLKQFISGLESNEKVQLTNMLDEEMDKINSKNKMHKIQQMQQMNSGANYNQKYYQKSSNSGGSGGYSSGQGKPQQAQQAGKGNNEDQYSENYGPKKKKQNNNPKKNIPRNQEKPAFKINPDNIKYAGNNK